MRLAIYGGTFDPIHSAHLAVAQEAADAFELDRVLFVVAAHPPHKMGVRVESFEDRFCMTELACAGEPRFEVSDIEKDTERSYSIVTIDKIRATLAPSDQLFFLIGADAFAEIQTWYRWRDVVASVEFIVVDRPGHQFTVPAGARVHRLDSLCMDVSSSEIREELSRGEAPADLPEPVLAYIRERGLYGSGAAGSHSS